MKKALMVAVLCGGLCAVEAGAATVTWTGLAGDWDYGAAGNWTALPKNNDYQDVAVFGASTSAGTVNLATPYGTDTTPQHEGLRLESAGWTLNVDYQDLGNVNSAGAGTNTINYGFEVQQAGTWTIGAGNTLLIKGVLYERNFNINLIGGGTLETTVPLGGYSAGAWGIHLKEGTTLRVDAAGPYAAASSGKLYIFDADSKLELLSTVASAQALIGTRIVDENSLGLAVRDIGGGYVQVYVPEPGTAAMLSLAGLAAIGRRSRRTA